jgi:hypothetical protein
VPIGAALFFDLPDHLAKLSKDNEGDERHENLSLDRLFVMVLQLSPFLALKSVTSYS